MCGARQSRDVDPVRLSLERRHGLGDRRDRPPVRRQHANHQELGRPHDVVAVQSDWFLRAARDAQLGVGAHARGDLLACGVCDHESVRAGRLDDLDWASKVATDLASCPCFPDRSPPRAGCRDHLGAVGELALVGARRRKHDRRMSLALEHDSARAVARPTLPSSRFIEGEPMKSATNRLAGEL